MGSSFKCNIEDIDNTITALVKKHFNNGNSELIREMFTAIAKFGCESTSRGDMKLLNTNIKELRYSFGIFSKYREVRKVAIFGSARTRNTHPNYHLTEEVARLLTEHGFMIITGAGGGIMEAGNKGAGPGNSFGVNIRLPFEQKANPFINGERLINFKYFFTRKLIFLKESDATILLPGGFGTLDEGMEIITLLQTGKTKPRPIVLLQGKDDNYWDRFMDFLDESLRKYGLISENDLSLVKIVNTVEDAVNEITKFYSVYHSVRYLKDVTIIRLNRIIPDHIIESLNLSFKDIIAKGKIESCSPVKEEMENSEFLDLPRLKMHFNKRNFDRLIEMIRFINQNVT